MSGSYKGTHTSVLWTLPSDFAELFQTYLINEFVVKSLSQCLIDGLPGEFVGFNAHDVGEFTDNEHLHNINDIQLALWTFGEQPTQQNRMNLHPSVNFTMKNGREPRKPA